MSYKKITKNITNAFLIYIITSITTLKSQELSLSDTDFYRLTPLDEVKLMSNMTDEPITLRLSIEKADSKALINGSTLTLNQNKWIFKYIDNLIIHDPNSYIKAIDNNFMSGNKKIRSIDISDLKSLSSIGHGICNNCINLEKLLLPELDDNHTISIGYYFLSNTKIRNLRLPLKTIEAIADGFLYKCNNLESVEFLSNAKILNAWGKFINECPNIKNIKLPNFDSYISNNIIDNVIKNIYFALQRNSQAATQEISNKLFIKYIFKLSDTNQELFAQLNLDKLKEFAPAKLSEPHDINNEEVVSFFDDNYKGRTCKYIDDDEKLTEEKYDDSQFRKALYFLFKDGDEKPNWVMYKENIPEFKIAIKHMVKAFKERADIKADMDMYMEILIEGFKHCQTRQAMSINNIIARLGIKPPKRYGNVGMVTDIINDIKLESFNEFMKAKKISMGAHEYSTYVTILKNKFGLGLGLRGFNERIVIPKPEIEADIISGYLKHFNKKKIIESFTKKANEIIQSNGNDITAYNFRNVICSYIKNVDGKKLATINGSLPDDFDPINAELSEREVEYLLEKMRVFTTNSHRAIDAVINNKIFDYYFKDYIK